MSIEKHIDEQLSEKLRELDIDVSIGIKYCGDVDFYREVLDIAYQVYLERYPQLSSYFENKDYRNYTIMVHAIKSGAANIGAIKLSNMAKALEDAGKIMDCEYIEVNHMEFFLYYHQLMEKLADMLNLKAGKDAIADNTPLQEISQQEWRKALEKIQYFLEELELDMAEEVVEQLFGCKLAEEETKLLRSISKSLGNFDVEGAKEKIKILIAK
ncbi:MAG: Hpt domain-containing protein [Lachnospiraceae bacterium]|nr:Hpt domain-containing protein [Lachnospiraceae bacterium]